MAAPDKNTRTAFIALALAAAVAGGVAGALLVRYWPGEDKTPVVAAAPAPHSDPELVAAIKGLSKDVGEMREEQNAVRLQVADLYQRMETAEGQSQSDANLRASLPPPYVDQVDRFFNSPSARTLLSAKAQAKPVIKFGPPRFLSSTIITVSYTVSGKENYILVGIKILDYYDLQFDVLWDSMEGEQ
jgi:uncharacterized coiled-coil protein SlyX